MKKLKPIIFLTIFVSMILGGMVFVDKTYAQNGNGIGSISNDYLLFALFTIVSGLVVGIGVYLFQENRINGRSSDIKVSAGEKKNSIMLVGLGGSGKTALINVLCNINKRVEEKTMDYQIISGSVRQRKTTYHLYISDYRGQDLSNLVRSFIIQQMAPYTPMRFGYIDSLIFVVDLFEHKDDDKGNTIEIERGQAEFDQKRVEKQLEQWNRTAVDAIFGMHVVESLKYICLFINKVDLLADNAPEMESNIETAYKKLIDDLKRRCFYTDEQKLQKQYAYFDCIIGSAKKGTGIPILQRNLFTYSKPLPESISEQLSSQGAPESLTAGRKRNYRHKVSGKVQQSVEK